MRWRPSRAVRAWRVPTTHLALRGPLSAIERASRSYVWWHALPWPQRPATDVWLYGLPPCLPVDEIPAAELAAVHGLRLYRPGAVLLLGDGG